MRQIANYHDLVAEKARVQQKLALLKRDVHIEIEGIKDQFKPITRIVGMLSGNGNHKTPDTKRESLWKIGAALGVDLLVGPQLAKAGMLTHMVLPPLLKRISTSLINRFKKKK
ncbi:MAG: hypothetical protein WDO15_21235 [Bacteroidota bacterium]